MTCEEMSTLTRALTRPLQLTVETSGAFATLAVVTLAMFLSRLFTEATATRPSTTAAPTPIATLIRVVTVRLPSGAKRLTPLVCYGFFGMKVSAPGCRRGARNGGQGGIRTPGKVLKPYGGLANRWFQP